jgi:hypothetical protein
LVSVLGFVVAPAARSATPPRPAVTDSLPRFGADVAQAAGVADLQKASDPNSEGGLALGYPKLDRLYQLYNLTAGPHAGALLVAERDLGSLALRRTLLIPGHRAYLANGTNGAEWVSTFDTKGDHLYIAYLPQDGLLGAPNSVAGTNLPGLLGIDLATFAYTDSTFPDFLAGTGGELLTLVGLQYDETTDTMLILEAATRSSDDLGNSLFLTGWRSQDLLRGGNLPKQTPRPVRACRKDPLNEPGSQYLTPILVAKGVDEDTGALKTWVVFPCYSTAFSSNVVIARLDRATALDPGATDERVVVAPAGVSNWATDEAHGRMYLVNTSAETDAWVYEVATNAFVGILALSPRGTLESTSLSLGVDEGSGRLYARAPSYGFMIAAGAQDPVPQADVYPRLAAPGSFRLLVDAKRNRVLSLPGSSVGNGSAKPAYDVISVPPPLPVPPAQDPDARTAQVNEGGGHTVAQYGGNASAYGMRVLLSRGVAGAAPSNGNADVGTAQQGIGSACGFTDRELVFAHVGKTELSDTARFAQAASVDPDNATVVDSKTPSRCDIYNSYKGNAPLSFVTPFLATNGALGPAAPALNGTVGPQTAWDYTPADCTTPGGKDQSGPNSARFAGPTSVDCAKGDVISAAAESRVRPTDGLDISVAHAATTTKVQLDKAKGLVTTATARVDGVRVGAITIGSITSRATSFAHGRTGTAGTVFDPPQIANVSGPGIPSCASQCNVDQVVAALNSALAGRAEFRRVTPEASLAKGSPGGYEAGVLKSQKQQASDSSLSGDKSVEIPALELVTYNDNPSVGRARQVYQFAGVRADSHYGIQAIADGTSPSAGSTCQTCAAQPGSVLNMTTGALTPGRPLPGGGAALLVHLPTLSHENPVLRTVRQTAAGVNYSVRLLFASPRQAMLMATVWALLWAPWMAARRRRALQAVAARDPEGPGS